MAVCIATIQIDYLFIVLFSQKHEHLYPVQCCVLNTISARVEFGLSFRISLNSRQASRDSVLTPEIPTAFPKGIIKTLRQSRAQYCLIANNFKVKSSIIAN